jgi:hypothetical protein
MTVIGFDNRKVIVCPQLARLAANAVCEIPDCLLKVDNRLALHLPWWKPFREIFHPCLERF